MIKIIKDEKFDTQSLMTYELEINSKKCLERQVLENCYIPCFLFPQKVLLLQKTSRLKSSSGVFNIKVSHHEIRVTISCRVYNYKG